MTTTHHWAWDGVFYHVYPLGACGAPARNDLRGPPVPRLADLAGWIPHWRELGINALYLGPVFESSAHGYDTADYGRVDRRLGNNQTLAALVAACHAAGIRVILDGVFNHVGRDFWAFRDLREHGAASRYRGWFRGVDFSRRSPCGDAFGYEGWAGHHDLVKLELRDPEVRAHLLAATSGWQRDFGIDGLRLDAADVMDLDFLGELAHHCRRQHSDFWLMGEVVHGDYRGWASADMLDSVTNYEAHKGLWSSLVDRNGFEIAYALNRQFGPEGLYRGLPLYNFADNHDVDRVASHFDDLAPLYPLYGLLMTMPGVPSIYYGSEWGIDGRRSATSDGALRPAMQIADWPRSAAQRELAAAIGRLARLRHGCDALRRGGYRALHVAHEQLAFARELDGDGVVVVINMGEQPAAVELALPSATGRRWIDLLDPGASFTARAGRTRIDPVWPRWLRVLRPD